MTGNHLWKRHLQKQFHSLRHHLWTQGHACIGLGLLLVAASNYWSLLPTVTAIALIGRGAVLTIQSRPRTNRQDLLIVINVALYGVLVCLAIAGQSNATLRTSATNVSLEMLLDHAAAIVLLAGLIFNVYSRLIQPSG